MFLSSCLGLAVPYREKLTVFLAWYRGTEYYTVTSAPAVQYREFEYRGIPTWVPKVPPNTILINMLRSSDVIHVHVT